VAQTPISNMQPSLALTEFFPTAGIFPTQGGGLTDFFLGEIGTFAGSFVPAGVSPSGQLLSVNQNTAIFSLLGINYGGNGQTTFALPNLNGTTMVGTGQGPGLSPETIGEQSGSSTVTLHYGQTPANNLNPFGQGQSFDNRQPSLGITYEIATQGVFPVQGGGGVPLDTIGMIMAFAGTFDAGGYMACDGRLLLISDNPVLFQLLGTTYGGDGQTTFALPDLRGRNIIGASAADPIGTVVGHDNVTLTNAQTPSGPGPAGVPFDNRQPSLAMEYLIALQGIFPSQPPFSGLPDGTTPFLGQIVSFAGTFVPGGWALCDGSLLQINQNQALFALLGTTYGGDGHTTFALPDLRDRTVIGTGNGITVGTKVGANSVTVTPDEMPAPLPRLNGAQVTPGQLGGWTPLGSVASGGGYMIAWKNGAADQYIVWNTDSSGNYLSAGPMLSGANYALQSLETTFSQDLNGDGTVGPFVTTIEALGSIDLKQVADTYFTYAHGTTSGPQLKLSGAAVTVGQFGNYTPIGAAQMGSGYLVVWKNGAADQYIVWNLDGSGNYLSAGPVLSAASTALQVLEPGFNQDLNGVGGITPRTVIESAGSTTLAKIANTFVVSPTTSALGQQLKLSGAAITAGQLGNWTPIGAEQAADGTYEIAWKNGVLDQYIGWVVDSNGNYVTAGTAVAGGTWYVESFESTLHQDLNGDSTTGPTTATIETFGATSLTKVADSYFFNYASAGPRLKMNGVYVAAGQPGTWTPIGAEAAGNGFWIAWKNGALDQYTVWQTDGAGNYLSNMIGVVSGATSALQQFELAFHQDLNGDGVIPIEAFGVTKLDQSGNNYILDPVASLGGPFLKFSAANVTTGQFGAWTPIGAEKTASGYEVAWKNGGAGQYLVWNTDSAANWLSTSAVMSGSSPALQAFETTFQQDLNLDGVIGVPPGPGMISSSGTVNMALLTSHMASAFATPAGQGTGVVADPQSSRQPFLARPLA
jgi:microcystin-dependent protein